MNQLQLNGNADQKKRFLPGLIAGTKIGALAMSESGAGSDVVSMRTTAKAVDGGYLLNGMFSKLLQSSHCALGPGLPSTKLEAC